MGESGVGGVDFYWEKLEREGEEVEREGENEQLEKRDPRVLFKNSVCNSALRR